MKEEEFIDYNADDAFNKELEEYEEYDIFSCMNCGYTGSEFYEQESDLFVGEKIMLCVYCGGWVE